jgi:hypothetical protein
MTLRRAVSKITGTIFGAGLLLTFFGPAAFGQDNKFPDCLCSFSGPKEGISIKPNAGAQYQVADFSNVVRVKHGTVAISLRAPSKSVMIITPRARVPVNNEGDIRITAERDSVKVINCAGADVALKIDESQQVISLGSGHQFSIR